MAAAIVLSGRGLHGGKEASVALYRERGPLRIDVGGVARPLASFEPEGALGSTRIRSGAVIVGTVEHLFAALAGLGVRSELRVAITGDEVPLLGGGALEIARALRSLGIAPHEPDLVVEREGVLTIDESRYEFSPGLGVVVEVEVVLPSHCAPRASWRGDADDFVRRIAPARTFALERDVEELGRRGLARHVDPASVIVVGDDALYAATFTASAPAPDEPARHKLLDLIGDAFAHGGPPRGSVRAFRPGHAHNHAAFRRALDEGILRPLR